MACWWDRGQRKPAPPREGGRRATWVGWGWLGPAGALRPGPGKEPAWRSKEGMQASLPTEKLLKEVWTHVSLCLLSSGTECSGKAGLAKDPRRKGCSGGKEPELLAGTVHPRGETTPALGRAGVVRVAS